MPSVEVPPEHLDTDHFVVFRSLHRYGSASRDQLLSSLNLPEQSLDAALATLREVGLVTESAEHLLAKDPIEALSELVNAQVALLVESASQAARLRSRLVTVAGHQKQLTSAMSESLNVETIEGVEEVMDALGRLSASIKHSVLSLQPGGQFPDEALDEALASGLETLRRGVETRTVHQRSALSNRRVVSYLRDLEDAGAQFRVRSTLPFRMLLIDDDVAFCSLRWSEGRAGALVLRGLPMVRLMRRVFDFSWTDATPWRSALSADTEPDLAASEAERIDSPALTTEQQAILRMLAEGATDRTMARILGVTPRTITRRLAELFDALGVESRFQAGVAAHRFGIV